MLPCLQPGDGAVVMLLFRYILKWGRHYNTAMDDKHKYVQATAGPRASQTEQNKTVQLSVSKV